MERNCIVDSMVHIPAHHFTHEMERDLTVRVFKLDDSYTDVVAFQRSECGNYVSLPRVYGLRLIANYEDNMVNGVEWRHTKLPTLRPDQVGFVAAMRQATERCTDFIAKAATGKGKTVCGLYVAAQRGRATAVIVDQENLLTQWVQRAKEHLGLKESEIGIVQGTTATYFGKGLVICMLQTLHSRSYPESFYTQFGTVIFDEVHVTGAPVFSKVLSLFPAKVRFGLSATPHRQDALSKIIDFNLGRVEAELTDVAKASSVYLLESDTTYSHGANVSKMTGRFLEEVSGDGARNLRIAKAIVWLYESGRDSLVISDRVEQCDALMSLVYYLGVTKADMGNFARSCIAYRWEKDPTPLRKPAHLEAKCAYTPVRFVSYQKRIKAEESDRVLRSARIVFATYGRAAKGLDIPRLSGGIDATPRSAGTQVLGRILRQQEGKPSPIWITVRDINSYRAEYQLSQRLTDYIDSNAEVFLWTMGIGRKGQTKSKILAAVKASYRELREMTTVTQADGNYTLTT